MGNHGFDFEQTNTRFVDLLQSVDRPGDYCVGGTLYVPMPRVVIDGVGELSFPVPPAQIDALIEVAERAPYGQGTRTLVDAAVRDCWQIDAEQIGVAGHAWPATLTQILDLVARGLGLADGTLGAELYKLLIYRKGGFFAAHRDTEKVPAMVATLSLALPTAGAGGELVIRHGDQTTVFEMSAQEPSELTFAAFYADCLHEARPVTEGHRISLVFNLFIRSGKRWTGAPDYSGLAEQVEACLNQWRNHGSTDKLVWLLDHAYSEEGLSFGALKNTDAVVAQVLGQAADAAGCDLHGAVLHIEESGSAVLESTFGSWDTEPVAGTELESVEVRWVYLQGWVARDGSRPPLGNVPIDDGELHPPGALEDARPDEEILEEYQGNYGPTVEHIYRLAALVVWPSAKTVDIVASSGINQAVSWAKTQCDKADGPEMRRILARLADLWPTTNYQNANHNRAGMLQLLAATASADLAADFLERIVLVQYDGSETEPLAEAVCVLDPETAGRLVPGLVEHHMPQRPKEIICLLTLVGEKLGDADPQWRGAERECAQAALSSLGAALEAGSDAVARLEARQLLGNEAPWIHPGTVEQLTMDPAAIRDLFVLFGRLGLPEASVQAARSVQAHPAAATPDRALPAALADLHKIADVCATEAFRLLWRHASDFLLRRSGKPPLEPVDWAMDVEISCTCELCCRLLAFCRDPALRVERFKKAHPSRMHLEEVIRKHHLDLDHVTVRKSSPFTLVCTKNRASHKRRLEEYSEDVACMASLMASAPTARSGRAEMERLQRLEAAQAAGAAS